MNYDTVKLLKSCNLGCKYATNSMEQVLPFVRNSELKRSIECSNAKHIDYGECCEKLLEENGKQTNDPGALIMTMARLKTDVKLGISSSTRQVVSLMVDGCEMGVKSICKALKNCPGADKTSVELAKEIIGMEQEFLKEMIEYY